jgi:tyrosyl-tRNA synthetase
MSIPDELMPEWFTLLTDCSAEEIARLTDAGQTHPMEAKKALARHIVAFYHGANQASEAQQEWERRFSQNQDPQEIPEQDLLRRELQDGQIAAFKLLKSLDLAPSNAEARRLIQGGGMTIGPERTRIEDPNSKVAVTSGLVVRVGKRKIVRVRLV